jgi:hypothetical protein
MKMRLTLKLMGLLPAMSRLTIYVILSILLGLLALNFIQIGCPVASHTGSFTRCLPLDTSAAPDTIVLPPGLVLTLLKAFSPEVLGAALCMVVADSGATDHMLPDRAAFISYKSVRNLRVCMGNNSYAPVLGKGYYHHLPQQTTPAYLECTTCPGTSSSPLQSQGAYS